MWVSGCCLSGHWCVCVGACVCVCIRACVCWSVAVTALVLVCWSVCVLCYSVFPSRSENVLKLSYVNSFVIKLCFIYI